ncbi:hypothetical protein N7509_006244 [Penicillium cosmopolitanum]|uniref:Nuclear pore complex component n=1 Tax=Penicillium cosmopolitanum TaxID=1131564 RepID=A0A9X0BAS5_9EURO|nr:uncharacterized protein N7509_006244 [Penicillium cosmopolitanum]KAJ5398131.1 hypothetical protein N7509_006244 [Penicillium cosmopolitanum]
MASQFLPSTPKPATPVVAPGSASGTPGKWRHPQLNEIVRRQEASTFGDKNLRKLLWNGGVLTATWIFGDLFQTYSRLLVSADPNSVYNYLPLSLLQLYLLINVGFALWPLLRSNDDFSDIPLTPTQRALLGMDPNATPPATPGTTYVTPPRYRVSTSRKGSPASASGHSPSSPLSTNPGLSGRRVSSGPFSPASSPLFHKNVVNESGAGGGRRQSFGSSSPLARSNSFNNSFGNSFGTSLGISLGTSFGESTMAPSTPSPLAGKRQSLGLSNKWLYERSRRLSASNGTL